MLQIFVKRGNLYTSDESGIKHRHGNWRILYTFFSILEDLSSKIKLELFVLDVLEKLEYSAHLYL